MIPRILAQLIAALMGEESVSFSCDLWNEVFYM